MTLTWIVLAVFVCSTTSAPTELVDSNKCPTEDGRIEIRIEDMSPTMDNFIQPFNFRINNYGAAEYQLESTFLGFPILNIRMKDGSKPDTVKGGDLNGFYGFYRSFIVLHDDKSPSQIEFNDGKRIVFEIWNVYLRKSTSEHITSPQELISVNVLFEIGNKSNVALNPILSALKHMTKKLNLASVPLPISYDPYRILPNQAGFAIYTTSNFPFPNPLKSTNPCPQPIKVYLYNKPLMMSKAQLDDCLKVGSPHVHSTDQSNLINTESTITPKIYYTPAKQHKIVRRDASEAEAEDYGSFADYYDDTKSPDDEDEEDKPKGSKYNISGPVELQTGDDAFFPSDCSFLYRLQDIISGKLKPNSQGSKLVAGSGWMGIISIQVIIVCLAVLAN